jgi:DNA-binding GntR family transcriptional regulator
LAFYSYAEQRNKRPQDISPILVEMYVHAFQGMRCATKAERAGLEAIASAMAKGDDQTARDLLFRQFEFVRREMLEELSQPDWNAVLNSRRANCQ